MKDVKVHYGMFWNSITKAYVVEVNGELVTTRNAMNGERVRMFKSRPAAYRYANTL